MTDRKVTATKDGQDLVGLAELALPALAPGDYRLELAVDDKNSGAHAEASRTLRVSLTAK